MCSKHHHTHSCNSRQYGSHFSHNPQTQGLSFHLPRGSMHSLVDSNNKFAVLNHDKCFSFKMFISLQFFLQLMMVFSTPIPLSLDEVFKPIILCENLDIGNYMYNI